MTTRTGARRRHTSTVLLSCVLLIVAACAQQPLSVNDVSGPSAWGTAENVMQIKHLYIAGQPDQEGLQQAQIAGVVTVLNMRAADELSWDEQAYVENIGMNYINIPVSGKLGAEDRAAFAKVEAVVKAQQGRPILLHCASGNRVSAWLANHLHEAHGLGQQKALAIARKTGLTKQVLEQRLESLWIPAE